MAEALIAEGAAPGTVIQSWYRAEAGAIWLLRACDLVQRGDHSPRRTPASVLLVHAYGFVSQFVAKQ
jgi:hypothetical protein